MILTDSTAAEVGTFNVSAIASSTPSTLQFMCYGTTQTPSARHGSLNLEKNGTGNLQFIGAGATYAGTIKLNDGSIEILNSSILNGVISGEGLLIRNASASNATINGNNTYSGGTFFNGVTNIGNNNAFGTGAVTVTGSAAQIIIASSLTLPNNFQINSGGLMQYRVSSASTILTISGNISGNNGFLSKTSNGRLHLDGILTYTGSTNIVGGYVRTIKTTGVSTATATFQSDGLSLAVSFDVAPPSGTTTDFRFFQGLTVQTYAAVTLSGTGIPAGTTATYNSANSTLSVTVP